MPYDCAAGRQLLSIIFLLTIKAPDSSESTISQRHRLLEPDFILCYGSQSKLLNNVWSIREGQTADEESYVDIHVVSGTLEKLSLALFFWVSQRLQSCSTPRERFAASRKLFVLEL